MEQLTSEETNEGRHETTSFESCELPHICAFQSKVPHIKRPACEGSIHAVISRSIQIRDVA